MKKEKGITLIALVITIILLLILAGISIIALNGENRLFAKAKLSKEKSENAQNQENLVLSNYENRIDEVMTETRDSITLTNDQYNFLVSQSNKFPDYENRKTITFVNKEYTVENDGYVEISFAYTTGISGSIKDYVFINDTCLFSSYLPLNWSNCCSPLLVVKKGDVVKYQNTAQIVTGYYYNFR